MGCANMTSAWGKGVGVCEKQTKVDVKGEG
jgi:hypothetical protein